MTEKELQRCKEAFIKECDKQFGTATYEGKILCPTLRFESYWKFYQQAWAESKYSYL